MRLIAFFFASILAYGVVIPRFPGGAGADGEYQSWYGTTSVYVGPYRWSQQYAPRSIYTGMSQQALISADFPVVSCNPDTDRCTAPCPAWRHCESSVQNEDTSTAGWANLPAGTEVRILDEVVISLRQINSGTPARAYSSYPHSLVTGEEVYICGISGLPCQSWTITAVDSTSFTLDGSTLASTDYNGARAYVLGRVLPAPLKAWHEERFRSYYIVNPDSGTKTFQLAASPGGSAIDITTAGETFGLSFAGYTQAISVFARQGTAPTFTCNPDTDVCTSAGHGLSNGASIQLSSTGQLPGGLKERFDRNFATHCALVLDADTFQVRNYSTGSGCTARPVVDISDAGSGTHTIWSRASTSAVYLRSITGYPQGTTFAYRGNGHRLAEAAHFSSSGTRPSTSSNSAITIYAKVPAVATPGDYPVAVKFSDTTSGDTNPATVEFTLNVEQLNPLPKKGPSAFPAHESLTFLPSWEAGYTDDTKWWTAIGAGPDAFAPFLRRRCYGDRSDVDSISLPDVGFSANNITLLHYDAGWQYWEAARYFDDPTLINCGWWIGRKIYAYLANNEAQTYAQTFQRTFRPYFWHTREAEFRDRFMSFSESTKPFMTGSLDTGGQREQGVALDKYVERIIWGGVSEPCTLARAGCTGKYAIVENAQAAMEAVLWMIDETARERWYIAHQPIFMGFGMRALVHYYQNVHQDERIPVVVKRYLDAYWDAPWFNTTTNQQYYSPEPTGDRCDSGCTSWASPTMNGTLIPAYWWIFRMTGDETYLSRGDQLFDKFFTPGSSGTWPYNPKEISEMNFWIFDGFKYRAGVRPAF